MKKLFLLAVTFVSLAPTQSFADYACQAQYGGGSINFTSSTDETSIPENPGDHAVILCKEIEDKK